MAKSKLRLDTRRALKDGTYPVQIAVGYGSNIYLATGIFLSANDWAAAARNAYRFGFGCPYSRRANPR